MQSLPQSCCLADKSSKGFNFSRIEVLGYFANKYPETLYLRDVFSKSLKLVQCNVRSVSGVFQSVERQESDISKIRPSGKLNE